MGGATPEAEKRYPKNERVLTFIKIAISSACKDWYTRYVEGGRNRRPIKGAKYETISICKCGTRHTHTHTYIIAMEERGKKGWLTMSHEDAYEMAIIRARLFDFFLIS